MQLFVATHNQNKVREIAELLPAFEIAAEDSEAEETESTFAGNARLKARALAKRHPGAWILADDSGLEVFALNGEPGVYSARYSEDDGESVSSAERTARNNAKLLRKLEGVTDRRAQFTCAIALVDPKGQEFAVEGHCPGTIAHEPAGTGGFGYDPLFVPEGHSCSFAELGPEAKNAISHRGRALAAARTLIA